MPRETTEIRIDENGDETHESWLLVGAHKISGGTHLFDSEIQHQHWIRVHVSRCLRRRDLNRDWIFSKQLLMEFDMSESQWGAFVSSFGSGSGVPATLTYLIDVGAVPQAPFKPRLEESHREVKEAGDKALSEVIESCEDIRSAFDAKAGRREMEGKIRNLEIRLKNAPLNMEFAAKSLTKHVENVVTKAKADIEGMVANAQQRQLEADTGNPFMLKAAEEDSDA